MLKARLPATREEQYASSGCGAIVAQGPLQHGLLHILGQGGMKLQRLPRHRMNESQAISVQRLAGERAERKRAHWQAIAVAACEQCGRNRVPSVHAPLSLADWLRQPPADALAPDAARLLLSLRSGSRPLREAAAQGGAVWVLHGPEGGLTAQEEDAALAQGFAPASLGARVLRAETASVAALALLGLA